MTFAGCAAGQVAVGLAHVAFLHFHISFAVWLQDQMEREKINGGRWLQCSQSSKKLHLAIFNRWVNIKILAVKEEWKLQIKEEFLWNE